MSTPSGQAPRRAALHLLDHVIGEGRLLPELIGQGALDRLDPADRARALRLAMETLRGINRADRWLKPWLQKSPPLAVRNILRLGAVEIGQGAAAHGVVNDLVSIVGAGKRTANFKGLVNAVLRRAAKAGPAAWNALPVPLLPDWLRAPLVAAWGRNQVEAMEAAHFAGAPLDLTAKGDASALAESLGGTLLPTGSVRLNDAGQVSQLPGFDAGDFWVQDAAAALPVRVLAPQAGETVLDLCAAPGGKTLQLAAAGAHATALDLSESRLRRVTENLARTGLSAEVVAADALTWAQGPYDAVLLDAPCSATGTIRRHPDLPYAKDGSEFAALIDQQTRLFDHALTLVKPGGRLVFCTCSLLPDEGEVRVEEVLARHPGLTVERPRAPGLDPTWITPEGGLRLRPDYWPDLGGIDGFYIAMLRKPA
ncbi:MAG: methyltransferase domain-containing protein [Rhodobacterales bacterium]|jgi:16S rRNA (cytosine967-C5)-methyltransferase|nr:methyltransferase domain-containing protein [Rhodobacterales bacterium]